MNKQKYRIWDERTGKYISPDETVWLTQDGRVISWSLAENIMDITDKVIVEFCIDRKDCHGFDMYEGDVTNKGVVMWYNDLHWDCGGSVHPGYYFDGYDELDYYTGFDNIESIEIIGNIHGK